MKSIYPEFPLSIQHIYCCFTTNKLARQHETSVYPLKNTHCPVTYPEAIENGMESNIDRKLETDTPLNILTASALTLPGLLHFDIILASEYNDEVDFQYSHYQEGKRDIYGIIQDNAGNLNPQKLPQNLNPIEVDSLHGSSRICRPRHD